MIECSSVDAIATESNQDRMRAIGNQRAHKYGSNNRSANFLPMIRSHPGVVRWLSRGRGISRASSRFGLANLFQVKGKKVKTPEYMLRAPARSCSPKGTTPPQA